MPDIEKHDPRTMTKAVFSPFDSNLSEIRCSSCLSSCVPVSSCLVFVVDMKIELARHSGHKQELKDKARSETFASMMFTSTLR